MLAAAPGPEPDDRPEQKRALRAPLSGDQHALTGLELHSAIRSGASPSRGPPPADHRCESWELSCLLQIDAAGGLTEARPWSASALRKLATRRNVARQSAMLEKLSTNHRSDVCTWLKAPTSHHQLTEAHLAAEIARRCDQDRRDDREPAVAGRDPGEPGRRAPTMRRDTSRRSRTPHRGALLIGLAAVNRDAFDLLVGAHQRKTQIGLARITLGVERGSAAGRRASSRSEAMPA